MSFSAQFEKVPIWVRYVGVMAAAWLIDFVAFALAGLVFDIPASQAIARGCGALAGFLLHKFATFRVAASNSAKLNVNSGWKQFLGYTALWLFGWGVSTAGILTLLEWTHLNKFAAKFSVEISLAPINYLIMRRFIFCKESLKI